ncbi:hypothetical protein D1007_42772 [Hordeum vulgare]|nr:hypothetical protein D1007_42772 [Hordeum vulgare]
MQTYRAFAWARAELSKQPPSLGLGDTVKLLLMCLNHCVVGPQMDTRMVFERMPVRNVCDSQVGFWNPLIQWTMYRVVLRTFLFCPIGAVINNVAQVFAMWLAYMDPWKVTQEEMDEYDMSLM